MDRSVASYKTDNSKASFASKGSIMSHKFQRGSGNITDLLKSKTKLEKI